MNLRTLVSSRAGCPQKGRAQGATAGAQAKERTLQWSNKTKDREEEKRWPCHPSATFQSQRQFCRQNAYHARDNQGSDHKGHGFRNDPEHEHRPALLRLASSL
ncbi:hypothetical protein ACFB49_22450 [Sphingomonas sp. DBB INV C78]